MKYKPDPDRYESTDTNTNYNGTVASASSTSYSSLSGRELQLVLYVSHGHTTQQIADLLYISTDTVETHRRNIMRKLGVGNMVAAVAQALRRGLIQ